MVAQDLILALRKLELENREFKASWIYTNKTVSRKKGKGDLRGGGDLPKTKKKEERKEVKEEGRKVGRKKGRK